MKHVLKFIFLIIVFLLCLKSSVLYAYNQGAPNTFYTRTVYMPKASVRYQQGDIEIVENQAEYSYETKIFKKLPIIFSLNTEYIGIDEDTGLDLPSQLTTLEMSAKTTIPFFGYDNIYFYCALQPSFYSDELDFESSSFRLVSNYIFIYRPNEKFTFGAGVIIRPDFDDEFIPVAGFIYKPNEKITFNFLSENPNIIYNINDKLSILVQAEINSAEFEVDRGPDENVVLEYRQPRAGLGLRYEPEENIKFSLSGGGVFARTIKYQDDYGKLKIKQGFYVSADLKIKF